MINTNGKGNESESTSSCFLPNSAVESLKESHSLKVLLCCPLWPKQPNRFEQCELFKFLLWRGSTFERQGSKLRTSGKQQKCMRFLDHARLAWVSSSVCLAHLHEESGSLWRKSVLRAYFTCTRVQITHRGIQHLLTEVTWVRRWDVPGCLRWWNMESQTWHWLVASPPCLQPPHWAGQSGLASSTLFRPITGQDINFMSVWTLLSSN